MSDRSDDEAEFSDDEGSALEGRDTPPLHSPRWSRSRSPRSSYVGELSEAEEEGGLEPPVPTERVMRGDRGAVHDLSSFFNEVRG